MRLYIILFFCFSLISCSSTSTINYEPVCFDTEDDAKTMGNIVFNQGFNNRVSYWGTGDSNITIPSLGLLWAGFDPQLYCPSGGYPILITFDAKNAVYESDNVLHWAKTVLKAMIKEQAVEI
ncbi:hypothetical protein FX988_00732 [Paraglaciecola mesophila]|uniref:Lipoprotein n=1 Tax=Paraglaciecola mesophila TaxID=197222 RepID=A0A857JH39_9ALTE|nr:hypothetical protein [Paraglaciecola mesophila]QHJ10518.1 hypothetical protein FX988_00732 [Paraglaciecola mesophila]